MIEWVISPVFLKMGSFPWLCMNHAETWKKLARRLIFPGSALLFTTLLYDECAHGWLDGLNRLFMEADDRCYTTTHSQIYATVFFQKLLRAREN